jgi:hypothetical protein
MDEEDVEMALSSRALNKPSHAVAWLGLTLAWSSLLLSRLELAWSCRYHHTKFVCRGASATDFVGENRLGLTPIRQ